MPISPAVAAVTLPYASTVNDVIVFEAPRLPVNVYVELVNDFSELEPSPITILPASKVFTPVPPEVTGSAVVNDNVSEVIVVAITLPFI